MPSSAKAIQWSTASAQPRNARAQAYPRAGMAVWKSPKNAAILTACGHSTRRADILLEMETATASIDSAAPVAKANQNHIDASRHSREVQWKDSHCSRGKCCRRKTLLVSHDGTLDNGRARGKVSQRCVWTHGIGQPNSQATRQFGAEIGSSRNSEVTKEKGRRAGLPKS